MDLFAYLETTHEYLQEKTAQERLINDLRKLPAPVLSSIASGEMKLSSFLGSAPDDEEWLCKFKGTPLEAEAIALAEREIEIESRNLELQRIANERQADNTKVWTDRDALRLDKRVLELKLIKGMGRRKTAAVDPTALVVDPPSSKGGAAASVKKVVAGGPARELTPAMEALIDKTVREHGTSKDPLRKSSTKAGPVLAALPFVTMSAVAYKAYQDRKAQKEKRAAPVNIWNAVKGYAKANPMNTIGAVGGAVVGAGANLRDENGNWTPGKALMGGALGAGAGGALGTAAQVGGTMVNMAGRKGARNASFGDLARSAWNTRINATQRSMAQQGVKVDLSPALFQRTKGPRAAATIPAGPPASTPKTPAQTPAAPAPAPAAPTMQQGYGS